MRAPAVSSRDSVELRPLLLVRLEAADGLAGFGEAAPLERYDGVGVQDVRSALEDCRKALSGADGEAERAQLLVECRRRAVLPQALAAIDLALWDLAGRRAGEPVWRLLGATAPTAVEVNATISSPDRAGAASEAAAFRTAGFRCVKAKVAIGDDAGRLAAVRAAAGPGMAIRLDANGGWTVPEALAALRALAPIGIECCEEPVSGVEAVAAVAEQTAIPVAIDETAAQLGALERRLCDAVCLKIARCGGISGVVQDARRARAAGYECYLASTLDGPLGIAAALHAAVVVRPERPSGLATLELFERPAPITAREGLIEVPAGAGLGDCLVDWYG